MPIVWPPGPHSAGLLSKASITRKGRLGRRGKERPSKEQPDQEGLDQGDTRQGQGGDV
jgi:hypothetical protein